MTRSGLREQIKAIEWIRGPTREHWMPCVLSLGLAYIKGIQQFDIKPQNHFLFIVRDGTAQFFRPKKEFDKTLQSITEKLQKNKKWEKKLLEAHERTNRQVKGFSTKTLVNNNTKNWFNRFEKILNDFFAYYTATAFLLYACEQSGQRLLQAKQAERLRNTPLYLELESLLAQKAKEANIPLEYAKQLSLKGLQKMLEKKKTARRHKTTLIFGTEQKTQFCVDAQAEEIEQFLLFRPTDAFKPWVHGKITFNGLALGKATIIQKRADFSKICPGDIIITAMTTPDITPHLHGIAGIVTDEGGITCHAAIISREMHIPCIVGTRRATKTFHDGELIQLDAENGRAQKV